MCAQASCVCVCVCVYYVHMYACLYVHCPQLRGFIDDSSTVYTCMTVCRGLHYYCTNTVHTLCEEVYWVYDGWFFVVYARCSLC